ncbi:MAG: efflux transporter outer membrane subunit [Gemmatimonadales bacterium]
MRLSFSFNLSGAALALLAGCAVGPSPDVRPAPQAAARAAPQPAPERAFLDSLVQASTLAAAAAPLAVDNATEFGWLELMRDTQLVALVRTAVANNRDLQNATALVREFRANQAAARGFLMPEIDLNGGAARQRLVFGGTAFPDFNAFRGTADASWEVDFWGRVRRGVQAAGFDASATADNRRAVLLSLVADVTSAYLGLLELDEDLRIAERTLASRQQTLKLARDRFRQGVISELDVRQFESEVATAARSAAGFTFFRAQAESQLSVLLGQAPGPIPRGAPLAETVRAVSLPDSLPSTMLARRPDVMRARDGWSAAMARVGVAAAARLPRFQITAEYGTQSTTLRNMFSAGTGIYTLQAGVSVPLFTGGRVEAQQRAAQARADELKASYEQTVLISLREASDALSGVRLSRDALAAQESQVRALRRAVELAERRYENGVSSNLEVLDVERGLFGAEIALAQTQRDYLGATVQLYKVMGGNWVER